MVRVPFSSFRPVKPDDPPLDPFLAHTLTIRFDPRRQIHAGTKRDLRSFKLILEYIKALPEEPGGQHALIFYQGNRISQGISCADVADIVSKLCMIQQRGTRALMWVLNFLILLS
ncbi:hypothetical protein MLD38_030604 [Melastoma candidum]|uniref:Uncharacterized protein n=1 Tax=Melastoma candidum TaxID=119954 RepID=A0ACB9MQR7_9MYRT|nr:hypothetical protein MLD38_030604 [Melastoma candidum]